MPQPLEPLIFIAFDQRIDPAAVLETIQVSAGGQAGRAWSSVPSEADIQADETDQPPGEERPRRALAGVPAHASRCRQDTQVSVSHWPGHALRRRTVGHQKRRKPSASAPTPRCASWSTAAPGRATHCRPLTPFYHPFQQPDRHQAYTRKDAAHPAGAARRCRSISYGDTIKIRRGHPGANDLHA